MDCTPRTHPGEGPGGGAGDGSLERCSGQAPPPPGGSQSVPVSTGNLKMRQYQP